MTKDDNLISGLLRKRHELATEAIALRDQLARVGTAIDSIDHLLSTWGQKPDTGLNTRSGLMIAFRRHELRRMVLDCLRETNGASVTSTEIAAKIIAATGRDPADKGVDVKGLDLIERIRIYRRFLATVRAVLRPIQLVQAP